MEYKIIHQKGFSKIASFEKELNNYAAQGWRVITSYQSGAYIILGKTKH
ncbi:MAG: hypothetical protein ACJAS3_000500 [Roseivirga sp.]|jgi:hypothetical protein